VREKGRADNPEALGGGFVRFVHVGICVRDLERSMRFYCQGLGFEPSSVNEIDSKFSRALEVDGPVMLRAQSLRRGDLCLELLSFSHPRALGSASSSRLQTGLTHLSFAVEDLDSAGAELSRLGGTIIWSTRLSYTTGHGTSELLFVADPDGVRVELLQLV
jgi:catechol 2,3-dioxygenase-like lactoylglutathione lyase family enzyme